MNRRSNRWGSFLSRAWPAARALVVLVGLLAVNGPVRADQSVDGSQSPEPDPALVELVGNLKALVHGKPSKDVEITSLFTLPIDRFDMVQRRLDALPQDINRLQAELSRLQKRLAHPEGEIPEVATPELLSRPLTAPEPPVLPEPPVPPSQRRPRTAWAKERHPELASAWQTYDEQVAAHQQAKQRFEQLTADHQSQLALFEQTKAEREAAERAFEQAKQERLQRVETWRAELSRQRSTLDLRLEVARLRHRYLKALAALMRPLAQPARQCLSSVAAPRHALRAEASRTRQVSQALRRLAARAQVLANRVSADALVGFVVDRQAVQGSLAAIRASVSDLRDRIDDNALELEQLAAKLEAKGSALQRTIFVNAMVRNRQKIFDRMFLEQLQAVRRLARAIAERPPSAREPERLVKQIDGALAVPERIGSAGEAKQALSRVHLVLGRAEELQAATVSSLARWHLAFARETVTLLSGVASAHTRAQAYSLSAEFVHYLKADLDAVWARAAAYGQKRLPQWQNVSSFAATAEGSVWLLRLLLGLVLPLLALRMRKRLRGLVNAAVRRLRQLPSIRRHIGSVVRWAGFAQAVFPATVFALAGYAALLLAGFRHVEVRFLEVAFRWSMLFVLGRQALLGLTRQISRGQPALIGMQPSQVVLLRTTYSRLGLGLAIAAIADEWSSEWLGGGSLSALVLWAVWLWALGWCLWAAVAWRRTLGEALSTLGSEQGLLRATGRWMLGHRLGVVLSPLALLAVLASLSASVAKHVLRQGGFFKYVRARSLRRMSMRAPSTVEPVSDELPQRYTKEFPLYPILGEDEAAIIVREAQIEAVLGQLQRWQASRQQGSLVLVGDKGIGKTTLLAMLSRRITELPVTTHTFPRKIRSEKELAKDLAPVVGLEEAPNTGVLAAHLNKGDPRAVLLDEAHNLFLRTVDGYDAYEAMVRLVNFTSERVFWILVFNRFSWEFLNQSRRRVHYFRKLLHLQPWTAAELKELINRRNARSGLTVEFDEFLLDRTSSTTADLELVENVDAYFQLLAESSGGNPRVATYLWLNSLRPLSENALRLGLFRQESSEQLEEMDSELLFALAAICQHENLSVAELREELNVPLDFAAFAVRYLSEYDYIEPKHTDSTRFTLAPRYYQQVLKVLRVRHLLFE